MSGDGFGCAIAPSGQLYCWSETGGGPVARFERTESLSASTVAPLGAVIGSGAAQAFTVVDRFDELGVVWIDVAARQLSFSATIERLATPCAIVGTERRVECLDFVDSLVDNEGQTLRPASWEIIQPFGNESNIRDLAASDNQVCAVLQNGSLSCARRSFYRRPLGYLGGSYWLGGSYGIRNAHPVGGFADLERIAVGEGCGDILCGVSSSHELTCLPSQSRGSRPSAVMTGVADVSVRACTICAVSVGGQVACLRGGDQSPFATQPFAVPIEHAVQIAVGTDRACALVESNDVFCFDPAVPTHLQRYPLSSEP